MIDVIIPVYRGLAQTRRCIESVLATPGRDFAAVVVDDASPEPEIGTWLDGLARDGRIVLVRNERNLGFVRSANRGMELHGDRDVVLLNSDTEVANDWLDRLRAAAYAQDRIATATPFSNNATICSYPYEGWTGPVPGTLGLAALDRLFATVNARRSVDIPTAVGFCMFIRRACIGEIGLFDAQRFGRGYGEENDFCMRALKAGWRHVLAGDVFVFHEGGVSFSDERFALMRENALALVAAHPEYNRLVHQFILEDPARGLRDAIDVARMRHGPQEGEALLKERSGEPLGFYHFTGFDSGAHRIMAIKNASGQPAVQDLIAWYERETEPRRGDPVIATPWAFAAFADGTPIEPQHRWLYRERRDLQVAFPDPYAASSSKLTFLEWCRTEGRIRYPEYFAQGKQARFSAPIAHSGVSPAMAMHLFTLMLAPRAGKPLRARLLQVLKREGVAGIVRRLRRAPEHEGRA